MYSICTYIHVYPHVHILHAHKARTGIKLTLDSVV